MVRELLAEHWGEMICQSHSNTVSSRYTQLFQVSHSSAKGCSFFEEENLHCAVILFQDGILPSPGQLTPRPSSAIDRLQQDFLDLDCDSVCEIFRLKSEQEEVSDFTFSFGQTDVCEGLIAWMSHDLERRKPNIHTLRQFVCLHQVTALQHSALLYCVVR